MPSMTGAGSCLTIAPRNQIFNPVGRSDESRGAHIAIMDQLKWDQGTVLFCGFISETMPNDYLFTRLGLTHEQMKQYVKDTIQTTYNDRLGDVRFVWCEDEPGKNDWQNRGLVKEYNFLDSTASPAGEEEVRVNLQSKPLIRISLFQEPEVAFSYVGKELMKEFVVNEPYTMSLGWLDHPKQDSNLRSGGVIKHEFGHSLGLIHEQQRPDSEVYLEITDQDIEKYLQYYGMPDTQFNRELLVDNIIKSAEPDNVTVSDVFDGASIMMYAMACDDYREGTTKPSNCWQSPSDTQVNNQTLSALDKEYLQAWYGEPRFDIHTSTGTPGDIHTSTGTPGDIHTSTGSAPTPDDPSADSTVVTILTIVGIVFGVYLLVFIVYKIVRMKSPKAIDIVSAS